ncbi:copper transpport protein [Neodidymelliopsis sp. IMI 364377]|nr:copper transpport protein [Neodidymelliopsis sp. IMI 364377]
MDHDMPGMDHGHKCNMNMLFTWDTTDLCIVFRSWHISGTGSLIVALIGIILLTAGYEAVREASRRYEAHSNKVIEGRRGGDDLRGESTISCLRRGTRLLGHVPDTVERLNG